MVSRPWRRVAEQAAASKATGLLDGKKERAALERRLREAEAELEEARSLAVAAAAKVGMRRAAEARWHPAVLPAQECTR
jgi:hypothetical protein